MFIWTDIYFSKQTDWAKLTINQAIWQFVRTICTTNKNSPAFFTLAADTKASKDHDLKLS